VGSAAERWCVWQGGGVPDKYAERERHDVMFNRLDIEDSPVEDSTIHRWATPYQVDPFSVDSWLAPVTGRNGVY
jgi:hypothetical protein